MLDFSFDDIAEALLAGEWKYARTMAAHPHWYTLREKWRHAIPFEDVVQFIRDNGYREQFGRKTFVRLDVNDMKYWSMGAPLRETILINRAFIDDNTRTAYDLIAPMYDDFFHDAEAEAENREVMDRIGYEKGSVLDIGCGTGLFLEYANAADYLGIDISGAMLNRLLRKYPRTAVMRTAFESFHLPRQYDLVLALFGTPNYISAEAVRRIPRFIAPGGRAVVMFYAPGYQPVTYQLSGVEVPHFSHDPGMLPGRQTRVGNFIMVEVEF